MRLTERGKRVKVLLIVLLFVAAAAFGLFGDPIIRHFPWNEGLTP